MASVCRTKSIFFHKKPHLLHQHQTATNGHKIGIVGLNGGLTEALEIDFPTALYFWILQEIHMKMFCASVIMKMSKNS